MLTKFEYLNDSKKIIPKYFKKNIICHCKNNDIDRNKLKN